MSCATGVPRIVACLFAVYAFAEMIFALYHLYKVHTVQNRPYESKNTPEIRSALIYQILASDPSTSKSRPSPAAQPQGCLSLEVNVPYETQSVKLGYDEADANTEDEKDETLTAPMSRQQGTMTNEPKQLGCGPSDSSDARAVEFRKRSRTW